MYEDLTVEEIKSDIISKATSSIDTREGSFFNDMISAAAYEIWKVYQSLDAVIPIMFVDKTSGKYIDKRCADYDIPRKEGTYATAKLTITGVSGTTIPAAKVFLTADGLEFTADISVSIVDGTATITVTAAEVGEKYNVDAGTITKQFVNQAGITSVTNAVATGGTNPETDAALVERLYEYLQKPATSGNTNQYKQWALKVDGVGGAKVFPLWNGPGTVKVVIVDSNKQPVNSTIIEDTTDYIEMVRPIGATVTVGSGVAKTISIAATVAPATGYSLAAATTTFTSSIEAYFKDIAFEATYVSLARIGTILLGTDGITDYNGLKLNGSTSNVTLADEEIPVIGTVNLEV